MARAIYKNRFLLNVDPSRITLIGDSAGGNLAAALSLMARDRGEFMPQQQILIYPAVNSDYSEASPFPSVQENGTDFLLTRQKLCQYLEYYQGTEADRLNPYFAPILAQDLSRQPRTLILTAQFDPLRMKGKPTENGSGKPEMKWKSTESRMRCMVFLPLASNITTYRKASPSSINF